MLVWLDFCTSSRRSSAAFQDQHQYARVFAKTALLARATNGLNFGNVLSIFADIPMLVNQQAYCSIRNQHLVPRLCQFGIFVLTRSAPPSGVDNTANVAILHKFLPSLCNSYQLSWVDFTIAHQRWTGRNPAKRLAQESDTGVGRACATRSPTLRTTA